MAIRGFRHKGLERFFTTGSRPGIQAKHAERLRLILGRLNVAVEPRDMNLRGLHLHPLKGDLKRRWAVRVSGNWTFFRVCREGRGEVGLRGLPLRFTMKMHNPPHPGEVLNELCLKPKGLAR